MVNIREYQKNKEKGKKKDYKSDYKKEIAKYRGERFKRGFIIVVIVLAIAFLFYVQAKNKVYSTCQVVSRVNKNQTADAECIYLGNYILTYSNDGATCSDLKGTVIWNQTFEMQNPIMDQCKDTVAIADYNGHTIYIATKEKVIGEIETGMPIRKIRVASNGVVAAILDDSATTWIKLFDAQGNILVSNNTSMDISGYPVDLDISESGILLAVSYLYMDSNEMKTRIAYYNFGEVGQNTRDKLVSGFDYTDEIVPMIRFLDESTSFAIADDRLMFYKGKQIPKHDAENILMEEVQAVFSDSQMIGLVYLNTTDENKYRLDLYNNLGTLVSSVLFDIPYKDIIIKRDYIIIYNESECLVFNKSGNLKFEGELPTAIKTMIPMDKVNKFLGVTDDEILTFELR